MKAITYMCLLTRACEHVTTPYIEDVDMVNAVLYCINFSNTLDKLYEPLYIHISFNNVVSAYNKFVFLI